MTDDTSSWWEFDLSLLGGRFRIKRITRGNAPDIEVCTTRIVRGGRGLPWDERIAIHPMPDGSLEINALRSDETEDMSEARYEGEHPC